MAIVSFYVVKFVSKNAHCEVVIRIVRKNNKAYFKRDLRINKGRFNANAKKIKLMNSVIFIHEKGKWCCIKEKVSVLYF